MRQFHNVNYDNHYIRHYRPGNGLPEKLVGNGLTIAVLKQGDWWTFGVSRTSRKDHFNRKIGRAVAKGRAELALYRAGKEKWALNVYPWPKELDYPEDVGEAFAEALEMTGLWLEKGG